MCPMNIDAYEFGRIDIGGKTFTSDVIVLSDGVLDGWWRKEGHRLQMEDLEAVLRSKPEMLIIGTGYFGRMAVPEGTRSRLDSLGIDVITEKTGQAVKEFNRLQHQYARVVAALHLTC